MLLAFPVIPCSAGAAEGAIAEAKDWCEDSGSARSRHDDDHRRDRHPARVSRLQPIGRRDCLTLDRQEFCLDQARLAQLFAWMSVSAFGALILARLADRVGRRRIEFWPASCSVHCARPGRRWLLPAAVRGVRNHDFGIAGGSVSAIVLLAEELPVEQRARGQAFAAFASAVGGVLGYVVIPFLLQWGYSWRWLLAPCVAGILLAAPVARMLPADSRWARAAASGSTAKGRFYDIFHPLYRRRALTLLACAALDTVAGTAVNGWLYFEVVSIIGLSPEKASTLVVSGMAVGMLGFPLGAWSSEHFGRVPTVMYVGGAAWLGAMAFYWGPPPALDWPFLWLLI